MDVDDYWDDDLDREQFTKPYRYHISYDDTGEQEAWYVYDEDDNLMRSFNDRNDAVYYIEATLNGIVN